MPQTKFFTASRSWGLPNKETYLNNINYNDTLTRAMAEFSYDRMEKHRGLVSNNIEKLLEHKEDLMKILGLSDDQFYTLKKELKKRAEQHDLSKYSDSEKIAYIYLNWKFHIIKTEKGEYHYPDGIEKIVDQAIQHHYQNNSHHSEFYCFRKDGTQENKEDKVKIKELLKNMSDFDLLEMVADWMAVSQEYGTKCEDFAKATIGDDKPKPFSKEQKTKIFTLISLFEPKFQVKLNNPLPDENKTVKFRIN